MSSPASKKQKTHPSYTLLYHPGIPGRGEYIRLALEAAGVPYSDPANETKSGYKEQVLPVYDSSSTGDSHGNPPVFAPPAFKVQGEGKNGGDLVFHQTPNILAYLGPRLGMAGDDESEQLWVNQLCLTALDVSNEAHDTHHPVSVMDYYENQKDESLRKAKDFRENRIPKFFSYFERTLKYNESQGHGKYLIGSRLSVADTTWWQVMDGLYFAFPKEMDARKKEFPLLFETFYPGVKEEKGVKEYLNSDRRLKYSMGLYRRYPELDGQ